MLITGVRSDIFIGRSYEQVEMIDLVGGMEWTKWKQLELISEAKEVAARRRGLD